MEGATGNGKRGRLEVAYFDTNEAASIEEDDGQRDRELAAIYYADDGLAISREGIERSKHVKRTSGLKGCTTTRSGRGGHRLSVGGYSATTRIVIVTVPAGHGYLVVNALGGATVTGEPAQDIRDGVISPVDGRIYGLMASNGRSIRGASKSCSGLTLSGSAVSTEIDYERGVLTEISAAKGGGGAVIKPPRPCMKSIRTLLSSTRKSKL